jgi:hypothetical protein
MPDPHEVRRSANVWAEEVAQKLCGRSELANQRFVLEVGG